MDARLLRSAGNAMLLRERSVALCAHSQDAILLSRKTRSEFRDGIRRYRQVRSETEATRRQSMIERKLRGGDFRVPVSRSYVAGRGEAELVMAAKRPSRRGSW